MSPDTDHFLDRVVPVTPLHPLASPGTISVWRGQQDRRGGPGAGGLQQSQFRSALAAAQL